MTAVKSEREADLCERRRVIKDFCFPDKIKCTVASSVEWLRAELSNHFKVFGFTLNSTEELSSDGQISSESDTSCMLFKSREIGLNCICLQFNDLFFLSKKGSLSQLVKEGDVLIAQNAFCFMFTNSLFTLYHELIT